MALASSLQKTASKLMGKFGGALIYRKVTNGSYNAATGTISETVTDYVLRGVLQDVNLREANASAQRERYLIQSGDKKLLIAAADLAFTPDTVDKVLIGAALHQIITIEIIEQDNQPITYQLLLRA
jgi:hypothetical protein